MQIASYVIYELLIRMQELDPIVGNYITNKKTDNGILLLTSTGHIAISDDILLRQFTDAKFITQNEIVALLDQFILNAA
jgi:hypothetical protein